MRLTHKNRRRHDKKVAVKNLGKGADLRIRKLDGCYMLYLETKQGDIDISMHTKQGDAVEYGQKRFGVKAKRKLAA